MTWVALAIALCAAALLAGIESALISVSRVRARHAAEDGDKRAARLAVLLESRQDLLRSAMAAHHFFSIAAFVLLAMLCREKLGDWGILAATIIAAPVFLIGLELAPKSFSRLFPFRVLRALTGILACLKVISLPWRMLAKNEKPAQTAAESRDPRDGVSALAGDIIALKLLSENAAALLGRYAKFSKLTAGDLTTPLKSLSALPADLPLSSALQIAAQSSRRHHPVMDQDGELIGFLDAAGLSPDMPQERVVRQFTLALPHVSMSDTALRCVQILRTSATPFAVVMDDQDRSAGFVSLSAILDRLLSIAERPKPGVKPAVA